MLELLWKYLIGPIIADARGMETVVWNGIAASTGYNFVNTIVYAATAATVIYLIYRFFQKEDVKLNPSTAVHSIPFVLLGGTLRFLDDAQLVPYPFSIALITPLIYFLIASIYLPAVYKLGDKKLFKTGTILLIPVLLYTLTGFNSFNLIYVASTMILTLIITAIYYLVLEKPYTSTPMVILAFTQFFEGTASMLSTFYGYSPKQLITQYFNNLLGFPGILIMKILVLAAGLSVITDLEDELLKFVALMTLYAVGLATGFRVLLRVTAGV